MSGSVTLAADFAAATWMFLFVAIILIVANQIITIIKNFRAAKGDIPDDDYIITRKDLEDIEKSILRTDLAVESVEDSILELTMAICQNTEELNNILKEIDDSYNLENEESDEQTETEGKI